MDSSEVDYKTFFPPNDEYKIAGFRSNNIACPIEKVQLEILTADDETKPVLMTNHTD